MYLKMFILCVCIYIYTQHVNATKFMHFKVDFFQMLAFINEDHKRKKATDQDQNQTHSL